MSAPAAGADRPSRRLEDRIRAWRQRLSEAAGLDDDALDELEDHLRERLREELAAGAPAEEAFDAAARRLGDVASLRAELAETGGGPGRDAERRTAQQSAGGSGGKDSDRLRRTGAGEPRRSDALHTGLERRAHGIAEALRCWAEQAKQDLAYAVRRLVLTPGFTAVAVLTLALGIGANSAIFSLTRAALLRSAPVVEPERLAAIWTTCRLGNPRCSSSYPDYLDYRDRSRSFEDIAAYSFERTSLGDTAGARLVWVQAATGNYFDLLGVQPHVGRLLHDDDGQERRRVAVLAHDLWRERFGADPGVVGRTIRLNRATFEVVGVAPQGFRGLHLSGGPDVYIPLLSGPALAAGFLVDDSRFQQRGSRWIRQLVGRLAPGATIAQARAEMAAISDQLAAEEPDARGPRQITVDSAQRLIPPVGGGEDLVRFVGLLAGVVAFTLLLACANLANLLLARATARRREIGVRLSMGASKWRLVRQLLTESLLLAALGGAAGVLVGSWLLRLLSRYRLPGDVAIGSLEAGMDAGVLAFTLAVSVLTGLVFGSVPALQAIRADLGASLCDGSRGSTGGAARLRGALVGAQVALCLVLLVGSGLFLQALRNGLDTDLGFEPRGLAVAGFDLSLLQYTPEQGQAFVDTLRARAEALPGVGAVGVGRRVPLLPGGAATFVEAIEGYTPADDEELRLEFNLVDEGYFRALGLPVLAGRTFSAADRGGPRSMVISEEMARRWWPGRRAVGDRVVMNSERGIVFDVIGVVGDSRWDDGLAAAPYPFGFMPFTDGNSLVSGPITLLARTEGEAAALLPLLRDEVRALDPSVSLVQLETMEGLLADVLMPQRMGAMLLTGFGLLALTLATVGIYGVVGYSVSRRVREIGIRMALGADGRRVLLKVMTGMLAPVAVGLVAGVAGALLLSGAIDAFMYGVAATDPLTFVTVALSLAAVAAVASLLPARRATRVDPVVVLRSD